jgi:hypothetical protein
MRFRVKYFPIIGFLIIAGLLSVWYFSSRTAPTRYEEGFEQGLGDWVPDADLPLDPNNPGHVVAWNISRVSSVASAGEYSLELSIDGRQDDGTIWVERKVFAQSDSPIHVTVSFDFYSEDESFNVIAGVCAYVGRSNPALEDDFTVVGSANEVAGWKRYSHENTLTTGSAGEVWVAVGITVRWETEMAYNIDDITITVR